MINVHARLQDIIDIYHPMRFVSGVFIVLKSENKESAIRACSQVRLFQNSKAEFYLLHGGVPQDFKLQVQVFFVWLNSPMSCWIAAENLQHPHAKAAQTFWNDCRVVEVLRGLLRPCNPRST